MNALALLPLLWSAPIAKEPPRPATAVFAGGCFWGVEWVFEHVRGVRTAVAGYSGEVSAESVRIEYDPGEISYRQLLEIFFLVAHDPTSRDRQGPDVGPEYRAIVFYADSVEARVARDYVAELTARHQFPRPIVTEIRPSAPFRVAEDFHQGYSAKHPDSPYVVINDVPKLARLERLFPTLFR